MKKGFTLVELIAVIAIMAILLTLVSINALDISKKRKVKDYDNMKSIIEESAKVYVNSNSSVYNEMDIRLQALARADTDNHIGECKILYDKIVDANLLDKEMVNPNTNTKLYGSGKIVKITLDSVKGEYSYEYMENNVPNISYCIR